MAIEGRSDAAAGRIRLGMVGGGQGAFIGAVHRLAARMDDHYTLLAGALSSDPDRARASGHGIGLADDRNYSSYPEMAKREARLKSGIEAVAIVTPNNMHFPIAREFLKRGIGLYSWVFGKISLQMDILPSKNRATRCHSMM